MIPVRMDIISVADPGCLSRIQIFTNPGSSGQKGTGSRIWIRNTGHHNTVNIPILRHAVKHYSLLYFCSIDPPNHARRIIYITTKIRNTFDLNFPRQLSSSFGPDIYSKRIVTLCLSKTFNSHF